MEDDEVLDSGMSATPEETSTLTDSTSPTPVEIPSEVTSQKSSDTSYTPDDPRLMQALFGQESGGGKYNVGPMTHTGERALGIGQVMPATFNEFAKSGEDINNQEDNATVSQRYLSHLYDKYGDIKLALAAYNAGPGVIDKYKDKTENGTFDEISSAMEKDNAYSETRDYVPKVLGRYEKNLGQQSPGLQIGPPEPPVAGVPGAPQQLGALPQGRGSRKEFADTLLQKVSSLNFDTMSPVDQIKAVGGIYNSRKWDPQSYDTLKKTATAIWETADPEDQPNFAEIVGVPPITPTGTDVNKVINDWKTEAIQKVYKSGISPALFGDQLDEYLNSAASSEKDAYEARNRSTVGWALNRTGNLIRETAKGAVGMATGAIAGGVRLAGAPFGKGQETADFIDNIPVATLGVPARDFLYNTNENGDLVLNPDGTPQMHWQAQVAEGIGMIGGTIGTLGIGAELGVSSKVLAATNISANTLNMAGNSFKHVYNETGSLGKAYSAAAFAIPAAGIQSVSELGIISGAFSPTLKSLSAYDKARFLAQSFTKNASVGAASTAVADLIQQYGETKQTGEDISLKRTEIAALSGGLGAGIAGAGLDYVKGLSSVKPVIKPNEVINSGNELADFRQSLDTNRVINVKPESIKQSEADSLGVIVTPTENGGVTLSKKTDIGLNESYTSEELPTLIETLNSQPTPKEIENIAQEHSALAEKVDRTPAETKRLGNLTDTLTEASRPEYQNNIKAVENKVSEVLANDPGALPVVRDTTNHMWEHVETGKKSEFLKDVLTPEKTTPVHTQDLSDISHINVLDEAAYAGKEVNKRLQNKFDKIREKGLGAIVTSKGKSEIVLPKGLTEESKSQIMAHEVAHGLTDKLELSETANEAINKKLNELRDRASILSADQMANEVLLPEVKKNVKIPEGVSVKGLEKSSQNALMSKREFLANQIGAEILKRNGKDIGNYEILPEISEALSTVKLPELPGKAITEVQTITPKETNKKAELRQLNATKHMAQESIALGESNPGGMSERNKQGLIEQIKEIDNKIAALETKAVEPPEILPPIDESNPLNPKTGKLGETAFSKTVRETVPERPKTEYEKMSRIKGSEEAKNYVNQRGSEEVLNVLRNPESFKANPEQRIFLTDALLNKVREEVNANPTPENSAKFYEVDQMRGSVGTSAGQQLALLQRIRGTKDFADFLVQAGKLYREGGFEPPNYTEFQLKELKALYDSAEGLPEGVLRNDAVQKMWEQTLKFKQEEATRTGNLEPFGWPQFLKSYMKSNLLSGVGTPIIFTVGHTWMAPVFTALSHPIFGRGLVWKAMWNVLGVARANARRVWEGKAPSDLVEGLIDPHTINIADTSTYARAAASIYKKFGNGIYKVLGSVSAANRTLAGEGYRAIQAYKELSEKYAGNPDKFYAEAAKISLTKEQLDSAKIQAEKEGKAVGLNFTEADKLVRAYEIVTRANTSSDVLARAADWTDVTSLRGDFANPAQNLLNKIFFDSRIWESHPLLSGVRNVILPFGKAILRLSDFATDVIPGNYFIDKGARYLANRVKSEPLPERTAALQDRLSAGQFVGSALTVGMMGLARAGVIQITGEEEKTLGEGKGNAARTGKEFKEFQQTGIPPYSIIFPGGFSISYKDIHGLNGLLYGINKANEALDKGVSLPYAATEFFRNAYASSMPFLGTGTLNSPYVSLVNTIIDPEASEKHIQEGLSKVAESAAKMFTPASSLLSDIKKIYDTTPEESNQALTIKLFKDIPGVSELLGSKPKLNVFGEPVERTALEHIPGVQRLIGEVRIPSDEVAKKLIDKGIIVPEVGSSIKLTKGLYPSPTFQAKYTATREERVGKAYANSFTPDEWYKFIQATGPHIKQVANQIADSGLSTERAQELLIKRVTAIRGQAKKRFIRAGEF